MFLSHKALAVRQKAINPKFCINKRAKLLLLKHLKIKKADSGIKLKLVSLYSGNIYKQGVNFINAGIDLSRKQFPNASSPHCALEQIIFTTKEAQK